MADNEDIEDKVCYIMLYIGCYVSMLERIKVNIYIIIQI